MFSQDLLLTDLIKLEDWQKIQDSFSEVLEITLRTVSLDGKLLTKTSRPSRLCSEIIPKAQGPHKSCCSCAISDFKGYPVNVKSDTKFKCPFGLDTFVVPIIAVGDRIVASVILGPLMLKARRDIGEYAKDAERLGVKLEEVQDALIEINVFSYNKVYSMIRLLKDTFSYMAQSGYHKKRLAEIAPEVVELDPLFSRYYEEKILNALLNSCVLTLDVDSGSVMTVDKNTDMLHIKVASKMDKDIMKNTNIKMGEGIAGLAAATAKPIILPKDEKKSGLSGKLKRNYIKSSMIVPINKNNSPDVYGVINLNMVRKSVDFTEKDIAIVKELVNMASIALMPLQQTS